MCRSVVMMIQQSDKNIFALLFGLKFLIITVILSVTVFLLSLLWLTNRTSCMWQYFLYVAILPLLNE